MLVAKRVCPNSAAQISLCSSPADIVIYGGARGGGKTYGLLMDSSRHLRVRGYRVAIFRRELADVTKPGGLWDDAVTLFGSMGPRLNSVNHSFNFRWGSRIVFGHATHDRDLGSWLGAQMTYLGFDQLEQIIGRHFWLLLGSNRSTCGVRPRVRATCNPDPDSWLAEFIAWWIDQETGFPIPERSGVIRWFVRFGDELVWGDSSEALTALYPGSLPKSVTFIPATVHDNQTLLTSDPAYLANLNALPLVERERWLGGNWKIRHAAGNVFRRTWFKAMDRPPQDLVAEVRRWDFAATEKQQGNNPDWVVGVRMGRTKRKEYVVLDVVRFRGTPAQVEETVRQTAEQDGKAVAVRIEEEPGSAGKIVTDHYVRDVLPGWNVRGVRPTGSKVTMAAPFSAMAEQGHVYLVRAQWNHAYLSELEAFPDSKAKDDQVDASSGAFDYLATGHHDFTASTPDPRDGDALSRIPAETFANW